MLLPVGCSGAWDGWGDPERVTNINGLEGAAAVTDNVVPKLSHSCSSSIVPWRDGVGERPLTLTVLNLRGVGHGDIIGVGTSLIGDSG
jgi:hypothetical protein